MNPPTIEVTPTLSKYDLAVFIYEPNDGLPPIFKIASTLPGARITFEKAEMIRFFPLPCCAGISEELLGNPDEN
jgi:hypothetical protein